MEELSPLDALFLYAETARAPMHVAALQIYDPSTAPDGDVSVEQIIENVRSRAPRIDCYHRRLLETPMGLDHPCWISDGDFDAANHVTAVSLPAPGDWQVLCKTVAELVEKALDRRRPLWEMHVITRLGAIEGLPTGAFAILTKIHHAAVDGVAGIGVTAALHDLEPVSAMQQASEVRSEDPPSPTLMIWRALVKEAWRPMRLYSAWPALQRLVSRAYTLQPPAQAPSTRFNRRLSGPRVFEALCLPLAGLRACSKLADNATINDVVLTIVGGGMRRYLLLHDELPGESLCAMVPISTRKDMFDNLHGNQISQMIVRLGTHLSDPKERLAVVQKITAQAKTKAGGIDSEALDALSALSPAPWIAFAARNAPAVLPFNTIVTNVKGPPIPFYSCGAKLVRAYGMGPLADRLGVFHTALSYCGELTLSVLACAELVPDIDIYIDCLRVEYEALSAAAVSIVDTGVDEP